MFSKFLVAACAAALAAGAADATIVNLTFSGTVSSGYDMAGFFAQAGTSLSGASFVAAYRFDTALGTTYTGTDWTDIQGGAYFGNQSPVLTASLTIGGHSVSIDGSYYGEIDGENAGPTQQYADSEWFDGVNFQELENNVYDYTLTGIGSPSFNSWDGDVSAFGYNEGHFTAFNDIGRTTLQLNNTHLTVVNEGSVPEPASWAMMVGGFGLVGGAMRRRARTAISFG